MFVWILLYGMLIYERVVNKEIRKLRLKDDETQKDESIGELRAQMDLEKSADMISAKLIADFLYSFLCHLPCITSM